MDLGTRKIWLCGMTCAGNETNLRELVEPALETISGLQFTFHYPTDAGADYLESVKGDGRIVYAHFCQRHHYSMNHFLWQGTMKENDLMIILDSQERAYSAFYYEKIPQIVALMDEADIGVVTLFQKPLIIRYTESLEFFGSPHWAPRYFSGKVINIELDKRYFANIRGEQRDEFSWVRHYAKYFMYPAGSNHALLGLDTYGDPNVFFLPREQRRLEFRALMRNRGYELTLDGLEKMLRETDVVNDIVVREYLNSEKTWSDFYNYVVLGKKSVVHSHDPKHIIKI